MGTLALTSFARLSCAFYLRESSNIDRKPPEIFLLDYFCSVSVKEIVWNHRGLPRKIWARARTCFLLLYLMDKGRRPQLWAGRARARARARALSPRAFKGISKFSSITLKMHTEKVLYLAEINNCAKAGLYPCRCWKLMIKTSWSLTIISDYHGFKSFWTFHTYVNRVSQALISTVHNGRHPGYDDRFHYLSWTSKTTHNITYSTRKVIQNTPMSGPYLWHRGRSI